MDLNYLFYRQQIERSRADSAGSAEAREAHEELAREYERRITRASGRSEDEEQPMFHWEMRRRIVLRGSEVNPTMAVAITARQVGRR